MALLLLFAAPAHAACTNPAGDGGVFYYNGDRAALQYCDGENWIMAGLGSYTPVAVDFDGTSEMLKSALTGLSDDKKFTASFWVRPPAEAADYQVVMTNTNGDFIIALDNGASNVDGFWTVYITSADPVAMQNYESDDVLEAEKWNHVLISVDVGSSQADVYINGAADTPISTPTFNTGNSFDFTVTNYVFGGFEFGGDEFYGELADFWFDIGTYIDLSDASMRAKFLSPNNMPMYLGADGSLPTGEAPEIFLSGDVADWHTNKGTGGGFTETGVLAAATSDPGAVTCSSTVTYTTPGTYSYTVPAGCDSVVIETFGAGGAGGTENIRGGNGGGGGSVVMRSAALLAAGGGGGGGGGKKNAGSTSGGGGGYATSTVTVASGQQLDIWVGGGGVKGDLLDNGGDGGPVSGGAGGTGGGSGLSSTYGGGGGASRDGNGGLSTYGGGGGCGARGGQGGNSTGYGGGGGAGDDGCATVGTGAGGGANGSGGNGGAGGGFGDTVIAGSGTTAGNGGPGTGGTNANGSDGKVVITLSGSGTGCTGPAGVEGVIIYNTDHKVMQYCNGVEWVAMSKIGGTGGGGCSSPAGVAGEVFYDSDDEVMQYCNSEDWVIIGKPAPPASGLVAHYRLDETSGTNVENADNPGTHDGTFSGNANVVSASGKVATALTFDGTDDVVTVTAPAGLADLGPGSWAFWVYRNSLADGALLYKSDNNTDEGWWIDFDSGFGGIGFTAVHSSGNLRRYNSAPGTGEWFHVVMTWDGGTASTSAEVYINGEITAIDGTDDNGSGTHASDSTRDMLIGDGGGGSTENFDGRLDDIRIYNRVLSAEEVKQLYHATR